MPAAAKWGFPSFSSNPTEGLCASLSVAEMDVARVTPRRGEELD